MSYNGLLRIVVKILAEILVLCINLMLGKIWSIPAFVMAIFFHCSGDWIIFWVMAMFAIYYECWWGKIRRHCLRKMLPDPP